MLRTPGHMLPSLSGRAHRHALHNTDTRGRHYAPCGVCSDFSRFPRKSEVPHPSSMERVGLSVPHVKRCKQDPAFLLTGYQ